jgi:hypothetical protein
MFRLKQEYCRISCFDFKESLKIRDQLGQIPPTPLIYVVIRGLWPEKVAQYKEENVL